MSAADARRSRRVRCATMHAVATLALGACAARVRPDAVDLHERTVQPERPTVATHAGTVAPGYVEIETGLERDHAGDGADALSVPTVVKVGVAPRAQLSVQLPLAGATGVAAGVGDVAVGVKLRLLEDHPLLRDVAVLPQLKLATGGPRGTGTTDGSLLLIDSRTLGPVALDLNAGITWRSGDGTQAPHTATLWTASAGLPVHTALGWALELYGYPGTRGAAGSAPIAALLTGPTYQVQPALALDAGIIVPIAGAQPHAVYAGLVSNLGALRRR